MTNERLQLLLAQACVTPLVRAEAETVFSERLEWAAHKKTLTADAFFEPLPSWMRDLWQNMGSQDSDAAVLYQKLDEFGSLLHQLPTFTIHTAYQPTYSQLKELQTQLTAYYNQPLLLNHLFDPEVIGGFKLQTAEGFTITQTIC